MICLIGNAPSSGSTLLADLVDSSPYSACGPELEFFCNRYLYDFDNFDKNLKYNSSIANIRSTGIYPHFHRLSSYGLSQECLEEKIKQASSLKSFMNDFSNHFLSFRGKKKEGIVFEKTPQNINCIQEFLETYPSGYFIYLVRNPIYVYHSLRKRGWGHFFALTTWLINVAQIIPFLNHRRVILVRYSELVENPFTVTSELLNNIYGDTIVSAEKVKTEYANNEYRKKHSKKLDSWGVSKFSGEVKDANDKELSYKTKLQFSNIFNHQISKDYAEFYDISPVSFEEAVKELGYSSDIKKIKDEIPFYKSNKVRPTLKDHRKLLSKWVKEVFRRKQFIPFKVFKKPVQKLK